MYIYYIYLNLIIYRLNKQTQLSASNIPCTTPHSFSNLKPVKQSNEFIFSNTRSNESNSGMTFGEQLLHNARHGILPQGNFN